jgi:hypothetical protein
MRYICRTDWAVTATEIRKSVWFSESAARMVA